MTGIVIPDHIRQAAQRVRTRLPINTVELALVRYEQGWSIRRIADDAFISAGTLNNWRRQSGIESRGSGNPTEPRLPRERIDAIIASYRRTGCLAATGREFGRAETSIRWTIQHHAPDLLRPVGGPAPLVPDGWETARQYAHRHGRTITAVYAALREGRIQGATRQPNPRNARGSRWLIPAGTPDVLRTRPVTARPVDELAERRAAKVRKSAAVPLPARPLADWIREQNNNGRNCDDLAMAVDMTDGSRLRTILRGEQDTIGLATADRLLTGNDAHLHDVWPYLDDQVALHAWAKEHRPAEPQPDVHAAPRLAAAA